MKMKTILLALSIGILGLTMASCGGDGNSTENTDNNDPNTLSDYAPEVLPAAQLKSSEHTFTLYTDGTALYRDEATSKSGSYTYKRDRLNTASLLIQFGNPDKVGGAYSSYDLILQFLDATTIYATGTYTYSSGSGKPHYSGSDPISQTYSYEKL